MSWPPLFGPPIWFFSHSGLRIYALDEKKDDPLNPEHLNQIIYYIKNLCKYLPCGGCSFHCQVYVAQNPPEKLIQTGYQAWKYMHDFHNAVNVRLGKIALTLDEADQVLEKQLQKFGYQNIQDLKNYPFIYEFWSVYYFFPISLNTDQKNPILPEEKILDFKKFLEASTYIVPFAHKQNVRDIMISTIRNEPYEMLKNVPLISQFVLKLHNSICHLFDGMKSLTEQEFLPVFTNKFTKERLAELVQQNKNKENAYKKYKELTEKELPSEQLRKQLLFEDNVVVVDDQETPKNKEDVTTTEKNTHKILMIVFICTFFITLLVLLIIIYRINIIYPQTNWKQVLSFWKLIKTT